MAVVVKNTFLDITDHKFLNIEEPTERRCSSVPRTWKPATAMLHGTGSRKRSLSRSSSTSTQSDLSFCSTVDSFDVLSTSEDASVKHQFEMQGAPWPMHNMVCSPCELVVFPVNQDCSADATKASDSSICGNVNAQSGSNWTKLNGESRAFQPMATDTRLDGVANAVYLALTSSGQTCQVKIEKGVQGKSPTVISAELPSCSRSSARCYDVIHLARQTLEEITTRLDTVTLLSKRVQKEDRGYSLRSSIACIPNGAEDCMCWDLFRGGYCPRRSNCQWYHPQESDIGRIKVNIRCSEDVTRASSESQLPASCPPARHKISLGELV
jgi:hypothetical protein